VSTEQAKVAVGARNETVDALRGLAALGVCIFHLCSPTGQPILHSIVQVSTVTQYGLFGVTVFFVISGFIIPYTMDKAGYQFRFLPRFLLRRLARLEPPYLASIAFVLLLSMAAAATPGFRGPPFEWSVPQVLSHAGYLTGLLGYEWLNIVYWTLALEFQFYILIAIFFPLLATHRPAVQLGTVIVCAAAPLLTPSIPAPTAEHLFPTLILPLLPAFAAGVLTFKFLTRRAQSAWYWLALGTLTLLTAWRDGLPFAVAAGATATIIATVHLPRIRPLAYLGAISYSLYLVHVPISVRLSNLANRLGSSLTLEIAIIFAALAVCIAAAALLHWLVERPSVELAARIAYRPPSHGHETVPASPRAETVVAPHS
jgi:peptidoglycan/LPS O-acetylase OafA/YrhL